MPNTEDKVHILCDDCTTMTDWEVEFIEHCENKLLDNDILTVAEEDKVDEIYSERMGND